MSHVRVVLLIRVLLNLFRHCLLEIHQDLSSDIKSREPLCKCVLYYLLKSNQRNANAESTGLLLEYVLIKFRDGKIICFLIETVHLPNNLCCDHRARRQLELERKDTLRTVPITCTNCPSLIILSYESGTVHSIRASLCESTICFSVRSNRTTINKKDTFL